MKTVRNLLLALLVLSGISALLLYLNLNRIVSHAIESGATDAIGLHTTVHSARLSVRGGQITIKDLRIASPRGFAWPDLLVIGRADASVGYHHLTDRPIHLTDLSLQGPILVVESSGGKFNFDAIRPGDENAGGDDPRFAIDKLTIRNAKVVVRLREEGPHARSDELIISIPNLTVEDVGENTTKGLPVSELARSVIGALVECAASHTGRSSEFRPVLQDAARSLSASHPPAVAIRPVSTAVPAK